MSPFLYSAIERVLASFSGVGAGRAYVVDGDAFLALQDAFKRYQQIPKEIQDEMMTQRERLEMAHARHYFNMLPPIAAAEKVAHHYACMASMAVDAAQVAQRYRCNTEVDPAVAELLAYVVRKIGDHYKSTFGCNPPWAPVAVREEKEKGWVKLAKLNNI